jgi:hypothetical protein
MSRSFQTSTAISLELFMNCAGGAAGGPSARKLPAEIANNAKYIKAISIWRMLY